MDQKHFNRRKFLMASSLAILASAAPFPIIRYFSSGGRNPSGGKRRKNAYNVVFITADDIGWKDLSCDGNPNIQTPHLDALASQGIRFENAFGVSSSCSSSRASFITGQYISTHGVDGLTHRYPTKQLSPFHPTMAEAFKKNGYHTGIQGKWHVAPFIPIGFYGYKDYLGTPFPWNHIHDTKKIDKYFEKRARDEKPFYLELNLTDTHRTSGGKFEKDSEFSVDPNSIHAPEYMGLPDWPEIREDLALYYAKVQRTDKLVGETLEALVRHGLEENTIVVFVSDNGAPFPGNKMALLDRGIGTPLLMRFPKKIEEGRVSSALVSTIDIMPTLLDLCDVKVGKEVEGLSFAPLLKDSTISEHRQYVLAEMNCHVKSIPMRAVRTKEWKAILNLSDSPLGLDDLEGVPWAEKLCELEDQPWLRPRVPFELYNLAHDPQEKMNLAGQSEHAQIEQDLRARLTRDWKQRT
jgi:N-sulfoglucosamine sulfohydrolase